MKKGKPSALLPIAVFLVFYLGLGIYSEYILKIPMGFYNIPIVVAFLAAILVACLQNRSVPFEEKLALMGQGIGDKNIITMLLIFLAAGTFVGVVGRSSAESVAYFMLSWIPAKYAVAVLFVVACFVSTAMEPPSERSRFSCRSPLLLPRPPAFRWRSASPPSWADPCSATTSPSSPTRQSPPATDRAAR